MFDSCRGHIGLFFGLPLTFLPIRSLSQCQIYSLSLKKFAAAAQVLLITASIRGRQRNKTKKLNLLRKF
jgi:hypothetical protein